MGAALSVVEWYSEWSLGRNQLLVKAAATPNRASAFLCVSLTLRSKKYFLVLLRGSSIYNYSVFLSKVSFIF